ncbi:MAG: hypothetical protein A2268_00295 [Candidatus Raymondbacteria bacterium RifOxyA12_full_50_37]|uniref:N-acetyltransferase domain-containing protein n=1 Tax=Candidatus Raymondbacteria bacterium RIFOXYD12_FULL_49_13 TaxID=1817890 RepID=A0A1F7F2R9_UNCRA|nr:MAG: hypothetical protein A2268_00295 [Candidatus Raymondbacteria bacterium RifOxyA12_full_50_37]OGJ92756.1 MAG: hypothetical protein A2248_04345 [Candidatus Raymondbacteria bacterium RIFOXYA2_FULL_49_16]OGK00959.1 MAG: hypothetical protein A2519_17005 [Candidatus Raymondbacteria bacterium RIFOXYD12_FULL_49_13]OGK04165.1 MAG: hypothetical protein A2350_02560 [Candidatus Raymondbacteria bacterium RifOxyB12_full_50_8]OGK04535.1 MAG: hypothetical protein A2487_08860 [Candidatus Raymondbacteria 
MKSSELKQAVRIRKGRDSDINALLSLYRKERAVSDFVGLHTRARFKRLIRSKDDLLIVAENGQGVAGALDAEFYRESRFSYFANLVVSAKERRNKIGTRLVAAYEQICRKRGITRVVALVYNWNTGMHKLMKRGQYRNSGTLVEYIKTLR